MSDEYIYLDNELTVMFDVDDTLLMWDNHTQPGDGKIQIVCPYNGENYYLTPHQNHIDFLKMLSGRGYMVTVWSANGAAWAKTAVDTLGIGKYVTLVRGKPLKYVDDLEAKDILGTRVYFDYKEK